LKITTIIPTYNRQNHIKRAIESVLNQSTKVDEIIVVDDGSTDDTKELIKDYPIKYIYQQNSGVSSARNSGIKESNGDFLTFLDSDDEWHFDKISKQLEFHTKNKDILFSHTNEKWMRDNKEIKIKGANKKFGGFIFEDILSHCTIGASTVMIHRDIVDDIGLFDESLEICEDYDLWLRVAKKYQIGYIDEPLITKYAGDWEQLSFKYWGMDRWRIESLKKHDSNQKVRDEIIKKSKILLKGAIKNQNSEVEQKYKSIISYYETL
jgi:glycosyltransferase involved in cell wall biosynthesis